MVMPPVRPVFSGPFKRAELLLLPQYAASDNFLSAGKWTGTRNHVLSCNSNDSEAALATEPLYCIVVGTVSPDKAYLDKHGNFTPKFNEDARKAKIQFTITRPNDPDFGPDYDKAVAAFEERQNVISETLDHRYFLLKDENNAMRMNYGLFEAKGDTDDSERTKESLTYRVDPTYETHWTNAKISSYCCIMPVFDTADSPVNPKRFAEKLVGSLCEVTFTLRHYAIGGRTRPDGGYADANDVFSAQVETVAIFKNPPVLARSPYKGRLARRPQHKPQIPTRGEQINAALAFLPLPEAFPTSTTPTMKPATSNTPTPPSLKETISKPMTSVSEPAAAAYPESASENDNTDIIVSSTPGNAAPNLNTITVPLSKKRKLGK